MENKTRLKPVVYTSARFNRGTQNTTQQMFLLKALQVTQDPKKLRQIIGVKSVAEVYRTLDKLAMRKEYHESLARAGISFDFIAGGIRDIAISGEKDGDRLKAYQTLLKSVGMDDYKEQEGSNTGTWEEVLLKKIEEEKGNSISQISIPSQYEVKQPVIPESARKAMEDEDEITSSIYDSNPNK